jgi:hypothetical protein
VRKKVRLTSGPIVEKNGKKVQMLELTGTWEGNGKPVPLRARYEVDLDRLRKDGDAAARAIEGWLPGKDGLRKRSPSDFEMVFYRVRMIQAGEVTVGEKPVHLAEKSRSAYDVRLLRTTVSTKHFGEGDAPRSGFEVWIGDKVFFGVAKWRMSTVMIGQKIIITGTLTGTGRVPPTTTRTATTSGPPRH